MIPYHWNIIGLFFNIFLQLLGYFTKVEVEPFIFMQHAIFIISSFINFSIIPAEILF
jgi:hypothetical protein